MSRASVNIASYLPAMAERQPFAPAVVFPHGRSASGRVTYEHYTYRQLNDESDRIARGLERTGIGRGVRTVLMVRPSLEFFALTFGIFKAGAVPVLVDPGIGRENLGSCIAEAEPTAFIAIPLGHVARVLLGWGRRTVKTSVTVGGRRWLWGGHTLDELRTLGSDGPPYAMADTRADETAAILFTSGSTGVPKGVVYSHGNFAAQVEIIRDAYDIRPGEVDLPTFPLFALFDPALGMTTIVPDMDATRPADVDPRKIIEAIEDFGVTNMFGSPALLDTVGRFGAARGVRLPSLRRVISAGAPVPAVVLERFVTMLEPGARIVTPYGATESLPVCSIGSDEILGETRAKAEQGAGVCVGRPVGPAVVSIVAITDEPIAVWSDSLKLPQGEIGEIVVRGPTVTRSYFNREETTRLAKIPDAEGDGLSHRMGDVGYFDESGRLWFCGRKSHRVETPEGTLFSAPCEEIFNVHRSIRRTALVGVRRPEGTLPVLCVELEPDPRSTAREQLFAELRALAEAHAHTRAITRFLVHPRFPVDIRHNAKIGREKLAAWAEGELR